MNSRLLCLAIVLVGISGAVVAAKVKEPPLAGPGAVQLVRGPQNHLLVPASVNGHPASFLLDTGETMTFLQNNRATPFGVQDLGRQTHVGELWFSLGQIDKLGLSGLTFSPVEVALYDPAQFRGPVPGKGGKAADGIIGLGFLQRHGAIINCRTQQLFLQSDNGPRFNLAAATSGLGFTRIPMTMGGHGQLTVPCSIGNINGRLFVDTGAPVTVFDQAAVRDLNLRKNATPVSARTTSGRVRPLSIAEFNNLNIGGLAMTPQKFAVMDLFDPNKPSRAFTGMGRLEFYDGRVPRSKHDVLGLLGSELLYQRSAIIDLGSMSLFLK